MTKGTMLKLLPRNLDLNTKCPFIRDHIQIGWLSFQIIFYHLINEILYVEKYNLIMEVGAKVDNF